MRNLLNYISYVPKQFVVIASIAAMSLSALVMPFAADSLVTAQSAEVDIEADVKVANVTAGDTQYSDSVDARVDEVVKVQVWYHNKENFDSSKVAENLRVGIDIPGEKGKSQTLTGTVSADNSNTVVDTAQVNLSLDNAYLEYVEGSAKWRYNKGGKDGRTECNTGNDPVPTDDPHNCYVTEGISDEVVTNDAGLVLEDAEPCFAYEATVTVLARVKAQEVKVNKYVRVEGSEEWEVKNHAKPANTLEYMIRFENKGNTELRNVMVGDNLPKYTSYVEGSTRLINMNHPDGRDIDNDNVTRGGINVGHYAPGSAGYVTFKAKIDGVSVFEKCGIYTVKNVGVVRPEDMNEFYNTAHTDVKIVCENQPEEPREPGEELPDVLPSTGPAEMAAGLLGSSGLGVAIRSWIGSRRKLMASLLAG